MLNSRQKKKLENRESLSPKEQANLNYQIAQKMGKQLSKFEDINKAIVKLPATTVKKRLNDAMVKSIFSLSENILRILDYRPLQTGPKNQLFIQVEEEVPSRDYETQTYLVKLGPPTPEDVARNLMLRDHIDKLKKFAYPDTQIPLKASLDFPGLNSQIGKEGYELYKTWMGQR